MCLTERHPPSQGHWPMPSYELEFRSPLHALALGQASSSSLMCEASLVTALPAGLRPVPPTYPASPPSLRGRVTFQLASPCSRTCYAPPPLLQDKPRPAHQHGPPSAGPASPAAHPLCSHEGVHLAPHMLSPFPSLVGISYSFQLTFLRYGHSLPLKAQLQWLSLSKTLGHSRLPKPGPPSA